MPSYGPSGSSLSARLADQYQRRFGRPASADDPAYADYVKTTMPQLIASDAAALKRSQDRWHTADKFAFGAAAIPFAAAAAPSLAGLFGIGGGSGAAPAAGASVGAGASIPAAGAATAAKTGTMATLGRIFNSPGLELGVNAGLSLLGTRSARKSADQARADQLAANREALALERQRLEAEMRNADLDRADAKAAQDAINELRKRELDAAEEERAFNRGLVEQRETRLAPYRGISEAAMRKLAAMWGVG